MKSIEQLMEQGRSALTQGSLVDVAKKFTPTAAYDKALALHYGEEDARSCRFLAIIVRDYGVEAFEQAMVDQKHSKLDKHFEEKIIPGINFLEKIGNGKLMIVKPQDRGLSLVQYLKESRAYSMDLGMKLGDYEIAFKWQIKKEGKYYSMDGRLSLSTTDGRVILSDDSRGWHCAETEHPSLTDLRGRLYRALKDNLFSTESWPHKSVATLIIEDLKERGGIVAPRLWSTFAEGEFHQVKDYGLVSRLVKHAEEVRTQAVVNGACEQSLAYLELEVAVALRETERNCRMLDKDIPLLEKLRQGLFGVGYIVIPGPKTSKTYNFLLHSEWTSDRWSKILEEKGYGGSVLMAFFNIGTGMDVAYTGQCDAFLLQQHGMREKDDVLDSAQNAMEKAQAAHGNTNVPKLPKFKYESGYGDEHERTLGGFDKFLDENFPLQ